MSRKSELAEPPPHERYRRLAPEERQCLKALVADLRSQDARDGYLERTEGENTSDRAAPPQPGHQRYQFLWDLLALSAGLLLSSAMIFVLNSWYRS